MSQIVVLKLATGEDLIGQATYGVAGDITLKNPALILVGHTPDGVQIGMMPFMPFRKGSEVTLNPAFVVVREVEPSTDMLNSYNKMYGSGLVIANQLPPEGRSPLKLI
jgi:hypothetical protein